MSSPRPPPPSTTTSPAAQPSALGGPRLARSTGGAPFQSAPRGVGRPDPEARWPGQGPRGRGRPRGWPPLPQHSPAAPGNCRRSATCGRRCTRPGSVPAASPTWSARARRSGGDRRSAATSTRGARGLPPAGPQPPTPQARRATALLAAGLGVTLPTTQGHAVTATWVATSQVGWGVVAAPAAQQAGVCDAGCRPSPGGPGGPGCPCPFLPPTPAQGSSALTSAATDLQHFLQHGHVWVQTVHHERLQHVLKGLDRLTGEGRRGAGRRAAAVTQPAPGDTPAPRPLLGGRRVGGSPALPLHSAPPSAGQPGPHRGLAQDDPNRRQQRRAGSGWPPGTLPAGSPR